MQEKLSGGEHVVDLNPVKGEER
jgi:SNF family Na+-dependent transporter